MRGETSTLTYMPGQSCACVLANSAFTLIVPLVGSTLLSTNVTTPLYAAGGPSFTEADTGTLPAASAVCSAGSSFSGIVNATAMGSICVMVTSELLPGCTRLPSRTEIV